MIFSNITKTTLLTALLLSTSYSMEHELKTNKTTYLETEDYTSNQIFQNCIYSSGKEIIIIEEKNDSIMIYNPSQPQPTQLTSSEILGKSLAYGIIKGAATKSSQMLENLLYNAIIEKGPEAAAFLSEELGRIVGHQGGKFAVKLTVATLVNAMTSPIDGPSNLLVITNMLARLDGIIKESILKKIEESIAETKEIMALKAGEKAKELANNLMHKEDETKDDKSNRKFYSRTAETTAYHLTLKGLNTAEKLFKQKSKEYIDDFIKESEQTKDKMILIEEAASYWKKTSTYQIFNSVLSFNYPLYIMKRNAVQDISKDLLDNELFFVPQVSSSLLGKIGGFYGKVIGTYVFQEAADLYIDGASEKFVSYLKETELMKTLKTYKNFPEDKYSDIVEQEIAELNRIREEKEKIKQKQERIIRQEKELKETFRLWGEETMREHNEMIQREKDYDLMYAKSYGYEESTGWKLFSVISAPLTYGYSASQYVGSSLYNTGSHVVNGASYLCSGLSEFAISIGECARDEAYRSSSPKKMSKLGAILSEKIVEDLFLKIFVKGNLCPNLSQDEIILLLHTKRSNKDTMSYKICDAVVSIAWPFARELQNMEVLNIEEQSSEDDYMPNYYLEDKEEI